MKRVVLFKTRKPTSFFCFIEFKTAHIRLTWFAFGKHRQTSANDFNMPVRDDERTVRRLRKFVFVCGPARRGVRPEEFSLTWQTYAKLWKPHRIR